MAAAANKPRPFHGAPRFPQAAEAHFLRRPGALPGPSSALGTRAAMGYGYRLQTPPNAMTSTRTHPPLPPRAALRPLLPGLWLALGLLLAVATPAPGAQYDIRDFGASVLPLAVNTASIQAAVDRAHANGGGTVVIPRGLWLSGTVHLKTGVRLHLEQGATLKAAPLPSLFPDIVPAFEARSLAVGRKTLLYAENARDIAITGDGTISGSGLLFSKLLPKHDRPHVIKFVSCQNVLVQGVRLRFAPSWMQLYLDCDDVTLRGLDVYTHGNDGCDGVTIDSSRNVLVEDCTIDSHNDAVAIKSSADTPSRDILVRNCALRSAKRGIKVGTESWGGFDNVRFENCTVARGRRTVYNPFPPTLRTGIKVAVVDGGDADAIAFSGITVRDAKTPFFIHGGQRSDETPAGRVGTITLENIQAWAKTPQAAIIHSATVPMDAVHLRNVRLHVPGLARAAAPAVGPLPPVVPGKPHYDMFGTRTPASGVYAENIRALLVSGLEVHPARNESRPPLFLHDIDSVAPGS